MGEDRQALEERYRKAVEQKNSGEYDTAVPEFEALVALDPEWAEAHLTLGLTYGFVGRFDESLAEIRRALELEPTSVDGHLNLAKTLAMLGEYDEARQAFRAVLALQPDHAEARKQLSYFPPEEAAAGGDESGEADQSAGQST